MKTVRQGVAAWFGGKAELVPDILAHVPTGHTRWVELCCGSAVVTLNKPPAEAEILVDLNGDVSTLLRCLCEPFSAGELYDRAKRAIVSEAHFNAARDKLAEYASIGRWPAPDATELSPLHVERAWLFFVVCWMGAGGVAGKPLEEHRYGVRYTTTGGRQPTRFDSAVRAIRFWHERLRGRCQVLWRDACAVAESLTDGPELCVYVDWPYREGGAGYAHDDVDHRRLAAALNRLTEATVIVSEEADAEGECDGLGMFAPRLEDLFPARDGWVLHEHSKAKKAGQERSGKEGRGRVQREVLLVRRGAADRHRAPGGSGTRSQAPGTSEGGEGVEAGTCFGRSASPVPGPGARSLGPADPGEASP